MRRLFRLLVWALLLLQVPFAYGVYQSRQLHRYLLEWPREEVESPFRDLRGGIHVHSAAGGHSLGSYPEILKAARDLGYHYLFITEHPRDPLFQRIEDSEITLIYGWEERHDGSNVSVLTDDSRRYRFASHIEDGALPTGFQGLEIYNLHENAQRVDNWWNRIDFLYQHLFYPRLFYFRVWEMDQQRLQLWDRLLAERRLAGIGGNDAHQNIGVVVQSASGRRLFSVLVDPYEDSLGFVTTHVLLPISVAVNEESILEALSAGAAYVCFERIADPTGFSFHAQRQGAVLPMGSQVPVGTDLVIQAPSPVRFLIRRDGKDYQTLDGTRFSFAAREPGVYRAEVYPLNPPRLLKGKPWIFSNPIYVR